MDNEKGKSIISTGSSNLAKTEKLLSITQKILSEIKPQYESVRIGNQEWMTRNLDVDRFRNGDLIPHIESNEDWEKAGENGQPAWCYYDNDPENGKKYGKLYNWFAVNDPRGLAPIGWHVPSDEEWTSLREFLGKDSGLKMKSVNDWIKWDYYLGINPNGDNSSGFNALPGGYRNSFGFKYSRLVSEFWCTTEYTTEDDFTYTMNYNLDSEYNYLVPSHIHHYYDDLMYRGASVRCIIDCHVLKNNNFF